MKDKYKNSKRRLSDFLKYSERRMKGRERNSFERELQRDPFAGEALEGLESIGHDQIRSDIRRMKASLSARTGKRRVLNFYRVAASLLIIIAAGSLLIITTRKSGSDDGKFALNNRPVETYDSLKTEPEIVAYAEKPQEKDETLKPVSREKEKVELKDEIISKPAAISISDDSRKAGAAEAGINKDADTIAMLKADEVAFISEKNNARALAVPAAAQDLARPEEMVKGRIISSEDNLPLPGVTVQIKGTTAGTVTDENGNFSLPAASVTGQQLIASYIGMKSREFEARNNAFNEIKLDPDISALDEVVVVGYGTARKKEATGAATRIDMADKTPYVKYMPPEPENGKEAYDKYIEDNIRKPADFKEGDRVVVIISFFVTRNGNIDSIKILRSGGAYFSDESMRLVKEGPAWKPATENGTRIDDEVRIRIVFK